MTDIVIALLFFSVILPSISQSLIEVRRTQLLSAIEKKRKSRVIALIHRQETMSILGFPVAKYISIEDSERILRAIHLTPKDMPIDLILHTPGGLVLAAHQIARALIRHQAPVTVHVPHYAMSGGTLLALAADQIVINENAVLGPVDPQLGEFPAVSLLKVVESKPVDKVSDQTLILADIARKSLRQVEALVKELLEDHIPAPRVKPEDIPKIAESLVSGIWTHDYPITVEDLRKLGLPVSTDLPPEIYELMELYPQANNLKSSVQFIPAPYLPATPGASPSEKKMGV
jgi:ClpP class serine protease